MSTTDPKPWSKVLASEILNLIFKHNSRKDLQNIRLGCRRFNKEFTPLLFEVFVLRLDMTSDELFQSPPFQLDELVRSLTVLIAEYDAKVTEEDYLKKIRDVCNQKKVNYDAAAGRESFQRYQKLQARHHAALEATEMLECLVMVLSSMPNLQRVFLSDIVCRPSGSDRLPNCVCEPEEHDAYTVVPSSGFNECRQDYWRALITGLWLRRRDHEVQLPELVVSSNFQTAGLQPDVFDDEPPRFQQIVDIFINLKKLHLGIMIKDADTVSGRKLS
ncbi:MAG: hypothetical protein Q9182_004052 [Xanthomendoza sp. 2 TL-2023]